LSNYDDYVIEIKNINKFIFVDCCLYVFANHIFDSKNNGKSKNVGTTDDAKPVIKNRKTSSSTINSIAPKTKEQRLEALKKYSGF
jgi:hypothetical protein